MNTKEVTQYKLRTQLRVKVDGSFLENTGGLLSNVLEISGNPSWRSVVFPTEKGNIKP